MSGSKDLTRAEQVRLRREKENEQRMQRAVKEATRPAPPVTTRNRPIVASPKRRPAQNTRRRYQVALPIPSDDIRTFSIPRPRFGMRAVSFLIVAILGTVLYLSYNLPFFRVTQAQILGNQMIPSQEINTVLGITGKPIFTLKPTELELRLRMNYPEVSYVDVSVSLPNLVTVNLIERRPVIRWEQGGGYTWIAEDGVAFRPRGEMPELISVIAASAPSVPEITLDPLIPTPDVTPTPVPPDKITPKPFISTDMIRALRGLAGHVPPGMSIIYDAQYGFGWSDPRGWRVYFGSDSEDIELKLRVYEAMVNSLTQRGIRPALIDVSYPTAPYYRMN